MDYVHINMENYPRKAHFTYFKGMGYPYVGTTVNVDITEWIDWVKKQGYPFFHSFLYAITNAANMVSAFKQRIKDDSIIEYERCLSSYTVALEDETYCYCIVDSNQPLKEFLSYAEAAQKEAVQRASIQDVGEKLYLFYISSLPWLSYTTLVQPVPIPADSIPRITWGKYFTEGKRVLIPVTVLCHHGLIDGIHIHHFYQYLEEQLNTCQTG